MIPQGRCISGSLMVAALLVSVVNLASSQDDKGAAAYARGRAAFNNHDYQMAETEFTESFAQWQHPLTAYFLSYAYLDSHQLQKAYDWAVRALTPKPPLTLDEPYAAGAQQIADYAKRKLAPAPTPPPDNSEDGISMTTDAITGPPPQPAVPSDLPPPPPVSGLAEVKTDAAMAVAGVGNSVYFFARGLDGRIYYNRAVLGEAGQGWLEMDGDGRTAAAPAAGAVGTHVFVAVRHEDGQLYLNQADLAQPFGQWFPMNFRTDVAPAMTGVGNSIFLFATGLDQHIYVNQAVLGQGFSGWREVQGDGRTDAAPAAGAVNMHLFVAIKGLDGNVYLNQGDLGQPFGHWFPMNFRTDVAPAVTGVGNSVYFIAKSGDQRVFYNRAVLGQGGQGWVEVEGGGRTDAAPAAGAVGTHVFVGIKGLDGSVRVNQADIAQPFGQWFP
jgi:hypothetical protein